MIPADITDLDQVLETVASVEARTGCPDLLINSAGVTQPGYVQDHDLDVFKWMMDVNYFGTVNMIRAVLLGMIDRGSGYIVNISSMAGFIGAFGYAAYGASKYAVRGLSDVLRTELKPHDIGISIVFPPDTDTPQLAYENEFKPFETKYLTGIPNERSPEEVAEAIVRGISRGDYLIFPSFDTRLWFKINNLLGAGVYPIMDILVDNARRKKDNQEKG
jgi:3-dehydrosphinganine reductase